MEGQAFSPASGEMEFPTMEVSLLARGREGEGEGEGEGGMAGEPPMWKGESLNYVI